MADKSYYQILVTCWKVTNMLFTKYDTLQNITFRVYLDTVYLLKIENFLLKIL